MGDRQMSRKKVLYASTTFIGALILFYTLIRLCIELVGYAYGSSAAFNDVPRANPSEVFFDLRILTHNGVNCEININEIEPYRHCAVNLYPYNYPTFALWFVRLLGINPDSTSAVGVILGFTSIALLTIFFLQRMREVLPYRLTTCAIFLSLIGSLNSFSFRYALERGQVDLLVLDLILLPLVLPFPSSKNEKKIPNRFTGIYIGLILSSLTKIFTLPALVGISTLETLSLIKQRMNALCLILIWIVVIACGISLISPIQISRNLNMKGLGGHGFGLDVLLDAGYLPGVTSGMLLKLLFLGIGLVLYAKPICSRLRYLSQKSGRSPADQLQIIGASFREMGPSELYIVISTLIMAPLYIMTESINYKWIFLLPAVASLMALASECPGVSNKTKQAYLIFTIIFSQVFLSYPYSPTTYLYLEWLGHFAIHPFIIGGLCGLSLELLTDSRMPQEDLSK